YYSNEGKEAPSDWQSPVPVYFLTVSETPYLFTIAVHNHNTESLVNLAINWLKGALSQLGIGAKTSADYGYWKVIQG
ncbi:MAG: type III-B CRISPR module RAMP protein Cmr6, partial [Sulfolobales archaeon]